MIVELLGVLTPRIWLLLLLSVTLPALVGLAGHLFSKHRIAVNLAARTVALMGIGFGILATVATFSILQTGLRELQRRHAPIVVDLARRLSPMDSAWTRREVRREINLFRATQREVTAVVTWFDDCMAECLVVASDPTKREVVLAWAETAIGKTRASEVLATARFDGTLNLVVPSAVRDGQGLPNGQVLLIVEADWLADRAFRTALILVAVAYVLLFAVGVLTQRFVGLSVAERVKRLVTHLEMGDPAVLTPASRSHDSDDELGLLDTTIRDHVERSVARVSEADRHVADARAMATRIQSTATLAAGVAHDFNNLMMGVMANAEVLKLHLKDRDRSQVVLQRIVDCADRGGKLAQQMLAFSRGGKYNPRTVNLNDEIRTTLAVMEGTLPADVHVETALRTELPPILADVTQVNQVIANLYQNAIEAVGRVGTIRIATELHDEEARDGGTEGHPSGRSVVMTVADSGSGVAAAIKERVFEPFFTTKKRGSGMGLSAAHGIVTNHGGTITVEDAPDAGAVFRVCFPATSVSVLTTSPGPVRMRKGGRRVLLVDDEATILEATSEILSAEGYSVVTADNGVEAIRIARDYGDAIDAIILDLRMPVLSGVDAFDSLVDACPRAQIVVATGFELDEDARTLLRNGAAAFLNKPFRSEKLLATIAQVVDDDAIASPGA